MRSSLQKLLLSCGAVLLTGPFALHLAGQTIRVDAASSNQTLEGWGTSLAWFANGVGGWSNTTNRAALMEALFSPTNGLGLTYLRYNIGGGDDPACGTSGHQACITPAYHATPGYLPSASGSYQWGTDGNQRYVAQAAQQYGANLFEAVSYSPPYWMTVSGTSKGNANGAPNLAQSYFGTAKGGFADYLATVVQQFATSYGITFHHVDPMNEPGQTWWTDSDTKQEGCGFSLPGEQSIVQNVAQVLASRNSITQVAAMDENQEGVSNGPTGTTINALSSYSAATLGAMSSINAHAYSSALGSIALATAAQHLGKRLTMSEWGSNDITGQDLSNQILADMYLTRATAWSVWQPDWPGLVTIDYANQAFTRNEAYYVYANYTRFVRPGFQILSIGDAQSLAAFSQARQQLVIVAQNWSSSPRSVSYQLANFSTVGANAAVYVTSGAQSLAAQASTPVASGTLAYTLQPNSVTTFVVSGTTYAPAATSLNDNTTGTGNNQFNYQGQWSYYAGQTGAFNNDNHWSSTPGDTVSLSFTGRQARVFASTSPNGGIAAFSIDGGGETYFDTYATSRSDNVFLFATPTLGAGTHTLRLRVTGLKSAASTGLNVAVDRVDIVSGSGIGQGNYTLRNVANGNDLEVNGASSADGGTVDTYADVAGATNEHWALFAVGDGSYRIVNVNSGLDLEVAGASMSNGATVDQWQDSGATATNEHWQLVAVGDGSYRVVNAGSGLDLEVNGTTGNVDQYADVAGATNEHWTLGLTQ